MKEFHIFLDKITSNKWRQIKRCLKHETDFKKLIQGYFNAPRYFKFYGFTINGNGDARTVFIILTLAQYWLTLIYYYFAFQGLNDGELKLTTHSTLCVFNNFIFMTRQSITCNKQFSMAIQMKWISLNIIFTSIEKLYTIVKYILE